MEELMQRQIHDGEKTEKKLCKGEGKRVQISEWGFTSATLLTLDWGGGSMSASGVRPGDWLRRDTSHLNQLP